MEYLYHIITTIAIYTILSQSLNIFSGTTSLLSLTHAAFFGIGSYSAALISINFFPSLLLSFSTSIIISSFLALLLSYAIFRTYEDYFLIITLSFQVIFFSIINNTSSITNGPQGIPNIGSIHYFNSPLRFMCISIFIAATCYLLLYKLSKSSWLTNLTAISDDEILLKSLGKNVHHIKSSAFILSASIASVAGVLYAHHSTYIDPTSFTINESIFILAIVLIGGLGNIHGSLIASSILILLPEGLRLIGISATYASNINEMIFSIFLISYPILKLRRLKIQG